MCFKQTTTPAPESHYPTETTYPHLLSNTSCGEDLFEGQAHSAIASHIITFIKECIPCKIIGLEGAWGIGKTNMIDIITSKLNTKNNAKDDTNPTKYIFLSYDT